MDIKWQRLVIDGETCERCGATEEEVEEAVEKLKESLKPLGVEVNFEEEEISKEKFEEEPLSSNAIFVNGKPLEEWIDAETGESECCYVCEEDCRTVVVSGEEYEVVPSELILRAGLQAASEEKTGCSCGSCCP